MGHSVRDLTWARDNYRCRYCGIQVIPPQRRKPETSNFHDAATIDHLLPRCRGGVTSLANCVTACWKCNHMKANMTVKDFVFGKRSRRLHERIKQHGDPEFSLKDLHLAMIGT